MRLTLLLTSLLIAASAQASPGQSGDEMDKFLADKGLLNRLEQVRQSVGHRASELVFNAMGFLGVPYRRGGNSAETGFDCSGFVASVYQQSIGLLLPRKAEQQAATTQKIDQTDLQPGDLVISHPAHWSMLALHAGRFPPGVQGVTSTAPCPDPLAQSLADSGLATLTQIYGRLQAVLNKILLTNTC